jgi:hypothetical protein
MPEFRCRQHPDHPVTWRGTGCTACAYEQRERAPSEPRRRRRSDAFSVDVESRDGAR